MADRIQHRRGTAAAWATENPVLADGEWGIVKDGAPGQRVKLGDGATAFSALPFEIGAGASSAADIDFTPTGTIEATTVQTAIEEVAAEAARLASSPLIAVGASRAVVADDLGATLLTDGTTITIPADSTYDAPIGAYFGVRQDGATGVTIAAASGVAIEGIANLTGPRQLAIFQKKAPDTWLQDGPAAPAGTVTASNVDFTPTGTIAANKVQTAIEEVAGEAVQKATFPVLIGVAMSDESTAITTGLAKVAIRAPYAFTLTGVRIGLSTASSSGVVTVNVKEGGTTLFSTKPTIDQGSKTSVGAATAAAISDNTIADNNELTFDIDTAGSGAKGLKCWLYGTRTV